MVLTRYVQIPHTIQYTTTPKLVVTVIIIIMYRLASSPCTTVVCAL